MPKMLVVAKEWESFERAVLPASADRVQRQEMRRAFYAGWQSSISTIMELMDDGDEPTDDDLHRMDLIQAELEQFSKDVLEGRK